jgi:HAD superfamily hydrolase (TIGR01549 family)
MAAFKSSPEMPMTPSSLPLHAITFDVGDTLFYPGISRAEAVARVLHSYGYHNITLEHIKPLIPKMNEYLAALSNNDLSFNADEARAQAINIAKYQYLCQLLGIEADQAKTQEIACAIQEIYHQPHSWQLFPGTIETLETLKEQGLRLAIISNWTMNLEGLLQALNLAHFFDEIIVSTVVRLYKPQPEIFQLTTKRLKTEPNLCLHVGDSFKADVQGALAANFNAVLFDPNRTSRHGFTPTITTLPQLIPLLRETAVKATV